MISQTCSFQSCSVIILNHVQSLLRQNAVGLKHSLKSQKYLVDLVYKSVICSRESKRQPGN